jgi:signal transduction histidine kinase
MIKGQGRASIIFFVFFTLMSASSVFSAQVNKDQLKVAYLYNFLKHITWPEEDNKKQFVIVVYQDKQFNTLLVNALSSKKVKEKNIKVHLSTNISQGGIVDLIYIPNKFNKSLPQIANQLRGSQTLIVTDNSADKHNAMVNLIDSNDSDGIAFEINKSNIVYEQLKTSAQLLLLGGTELDIAYLYRETEQAMQQTRAREAALNTELSNQQANIEKSNQELAKLNSHLQESNQAIKLHQQSIKALKDKEQQQQVALLKKEQDLEHILDQLSDANKNYSKQTQAITEKKQQVEEKNIENQRMAELINQNKLILQQQEQNITNQQQEISLQGRALKTQEQTIIKQKATITITTLLGICIAIALALVGGLFWKNKKTTQKLSVTLAHLEETQKQLIQSEKMASLGKLIAGVAHEINTPLGIAVTSTSLIQENTEIISKKLASKTLNEKQLQSFIKVITESSEISNKGLERVIQLMHNFKEVAADQIVEAIRKVNLADYISEVMTTLANEMKKNNVKYEYTGEKDLFIQTTPGALAQVVTNLVNNSIRHGFEDNRVQNKENCCISIHLEQNNHDEVILVYKDNGQGMTEETLGQIFDPFFTTKRNKGGTGLGMNIVYNIIDQKLKGHIEMQSVLGEGITCIITLPLLANTQEKNVSS